MISTFNLIFTHLIFGTNSENVEMKNGITKSRFLFFMK